MTKEDFAQQMSEQATRRGYFHHAHQFADGRHIIFKITAGDCVGEVEVTEGTRLACVGQPGPYWPQSYVAACIRSLQSRQRAAAKRTPTPDQGSLF